MLAITPLSINFLRTSIGLAFRRSARSRTVRVAGTSRTLRSCALIPPSQSIRGGRRAKAGARSNAGVRSVPYPRMSSPDSRRLPIFRQGLHGRRQSLAVGGAQFGSQRPGERAAQRGFPARPAVVQIGPPPPSLPGLVHLYVFARPDDPDQGALRAHLLTAHTSADWHVPDGLGSVGSHQA